MLNTRIIGQVSSSLVPENFMLKIGQPGSSISFIAIQTLLQLTSQVTCSCTILGWNLLK
jgi:hypothetical protein